MNESKKKIVSNEEIEAILLSAEGSLELIEKKLLMEMEAAKKAAGKKASVTEVTDFSAVPEAEVFGENCRYVLFNRETKHEFGINGKQLESRIGLDKSLYEKVKNREAAAFCVENYYIKFDKFLKTAAEN